jgi:hypothetical protein
VRDELEQALFSSLHRFVQLHRVTVLREYVYSWTSETPFVSVR